MFTLTVHSAEHAQVLFDTINDALTASPVLDEWERRAMLSDLLVAAHSTLATAKAAQS